jgi:hypothetical protein
MATPIFQNVVAKGLEESRILFRSDDYDVTTCAAVTDVDFDGEKEIVLGTYGQELLVYKLVLKFGPILHWKLALLDIVCLLYKKFFIIA